MMIKSTEEIIIYESPDGGKTVYARKPGETSRQLHHVDPAYQAEQKILARWANLKSIAYDAASDPALNELLEKAEMYHELKYK